MRMPVFISLLILVLVSGCSYHGYYTQVEPPNVPNLTSAEVVQDKICFSQSDVDLLDKFFDKLAVYYSAVGRLK